MREFLKTRYASGVILLTALVFVLGIYVGYNQRPEIEKVFNLSGKETTVITQTDFSPFWKVWNTINEKYPDANEITDQNKVYGAISGLVDSLNDPYSVFFSPDETKLF